MITLIWGTRPENTNQICCHLLLFVVAGSETTMTSSSGQTFQITGTSVGGKVVTTKLSVPANSKIVTVNVPTSQGGMAALSFIASMFVFYYFLWASLGEIFRCVKTHWFNWSAGCWPSHTCGALKGGVCLQSFWMLTAANAGLSILLFTGHYPLFNYCNGWSWDTNSFCSGCHFALHSR